MSVNKENNDEFGRVSSKNKEHYEEFIKGEEGIDFIHKAKDMEHPEIPSEKLLAKQLRQEINAMKLYEPEKAKEFEKFYFEKDDWHEMITKDHDLSEVKCYPGSEKGPLPEDDPQSYTKWFVENQPRKLF